VCVGECVLAVAPPSIQRSLDFSVDGLQWIPSGYLLTYGGFMLLGGGLAELARPGRGVRFMWRGAGLPPLVGRRVVRVSGIVLIGISSLVGGFAQPPGVLVGARLAQGL